MLTNNQTIRRSKKSQINTLYSYICEVLIIIIIIISAVLAVLGLIINDKHFTV